MRVFELKGTVVPASVDEEGNILSLDLRASRKARGEFEEGRTFLN
jgi:hypothetical protein